MLPSLKPRFWMDLQVVRKIAEINHWFQQLPTGAIATPLTCLTLWSLWSLCTPISGSFECSPILLEHFLIAKLDSWTCHGVLHMCRKSTRYSEGVPPQHSLVRVGWFLVPPKTCQNVSFLKDFMSLMSLARNGGEWHCQHWTACLLIELRKGGVLWIWFSLDVKGWHSGTP